MANLITVQLRRGEGQPWGFRLQGGKDFSAPLVLQRVNGGSVADQAGLMPGDALVKVNSTEVFNLRHKEAQDVIMAAGNSFELTVSRGSAWRPSVTPTGSIPSPSPSLAGNITPVTKTSLAATPQPVQHIGSGHNQAAKPFPAQQQQQEQEQVNGSDPIKSIVNMQYNTPVAMYSDETIAETLSSQAEVLAGGVLGVNFKKNEKKYSPANSEVYKLLHEQGDNPEPANHHQQPQQQVQKQQQHQHQQHYQQQQQTVVTKHVSAPVDKPPSNTNGLPAGQNICSSCDRLIVGVFVRIKDKNLHADCFKCATCGTSLKNQGYFNLNGKLYCDIHARLAALQSPPPGTNGMVPVTIPKPGQKSGVQAISAALNAHANLNGRSQSPYAANLHLPPPPSSATTTTATTISSGSSSTHQSPSHSRSSSTTSSSGYCNSSSLSPVQSNKVSPLHSRTSSENELHCHYPAKSVAASSSVCANAVNGSDFSFPPPPPPPLLQLAIVPGAGMENPEVVQQFQQPPVEAVNPAAFGPNGLAVAEPTADSTDSAGAGAATNGEITQNDYGFLYKTMGGAVIRSVFPPGGAGSRYKNQNNIVPKPFGATPSPLVQPPSSFPPVAGSVPTPFSAAITGQAPAPAPAAAAPQSASYPPATTQAAPAPAVQAPAPAPAPAAVAPAAAPATVPTPQGPLFQKKSPVKQTTPVLAPGAATTLLDSSVSKLASINGNNDYRKQASNVLKEMLEARLKKHESSPIQQQQDQVRLKNKENLLSNGGDTLPKRLLNPSHPMSRIIDICDSAVPAPPPMPKTTAPFQQPHKDLKPQPTTLNNNTNILVNNVVLRPKHNNHNGNGNGLEETLAQLSNRRKVSSELTSHARDRRSYVEKNNNSQTTAIAEESAKVNEKKTFDEAVTPLTKVNKVPICNKCNHKITTGPFITALGRIWCPDHFICHNGNCKRPLADIGFVEEKGDLYCEYCFEEFLAPVCSKCNARVKGDCLNAIGKQFHPECFKCTYCGKQFGNSPFFLEEGDPYCETDWNELFTTKCFACGFPVEAGDKWVEALNNNYHSQCFNCTSCKKNLEGQSFFAKGGRPFCKNHAR